MKIKYIILLLTGLLSITASAQTLEQARVLFTKGEYGQAKPVFAKYVKSHPSDANYNYWYGVCCLKTGEPRESVKSLELATKRKVQNAPFFLGQAYDQLYHFEEAAAAYEDYIEILAKKKQPADEAKALLEKSKHNARMLKGVEEVCVIDSFVVDKANFLSAYKISEESGRVAMLNAANGYMKTTDSNPGTIYETEFSNKRYYSEPNASNKKLNIFLSNKMQGEWSKGNPLPETINNADANTNYPFVLADGITIYYASDEKESIGGYDIFVTRYNTNTDGYLNPENVGMPFNSPFNDYMYVIDEYNNLGWFASDRFQPEGKVCIYVFVPNSSKQTYNYEAMEPEKIIRLAQLHSIKETWKDEASVAEARKRLNAVISQKPKIKQVRDFEFVINDQYTYYVIDDFKSAKAKTEFKKYQQIQKDYGQLADKLDNQRNQYAQTSKEEKNKMIASILDLEKRVQEMELQLDSLAIHVRSEEIKTIKK